MSDDQSAREQIVSDLLYAREQWGLSTDNDEYWLQWYEVIVELTNELKEFL